jgi:hypothetical protein
MELLTVLTYRSPCGDSNSSWVCGNDEIAEQLMEIKIVEMDAEEDDFDISDSIFYKDYSVIEKRYEDSSDEELKRTIKLVKGDF